MMKQENEFGLEVGDSFEDINYGYDSTTIFNSPFLRQEGVKIWCKPKYKKEDWFDAGWIIGGEVGIVKKRKTKGLTFMEAVELAEQGYKFKVENTCRPIYYVNEFSELCHTDTSVKIRVIITPAFLRNDFEIVEEPKEENKITLDYLQDAKEKIMEKGGTPDVCILPWPKDNLLRLGDKIYEVDFQQRYFYVSNELGMDIYVDKKVEKNQAYLLDSRMISLKNISDCGSIEYEPKKTLSSKEKVINTPWGKKKGFYTEDVKEHLKEFIDCLFPNTTELSMPLTVSHYYVNRKAKEIFGEKLIE